MVRALLLSGLVACAPEPEPEPVDPAIELGTGDIDFEPLADGGDIYVIHGPQGGYHLLASLRVVGIETGNPDDPADAINPTMTFSVEHGGADITLTGQYHQGLDPIVPEGGAWSHQTVGRLCILDIADDDVLDGEPIHFAVEIADTEGRVLTDARDLVAVPHPLN